MADAVRRVGATLVLVTHDRRAGAIADRVVRIRDGRISETWIPPASPLTPEVEEELLVMDDRGWVRLPQEFRARTAVGALWAARAGETGLSLEHRDPPPVTAGERPGQVATPDPSVPDQGPSAAAREPAGGRVHGRDQDQDHGRDQDQGRDQGSHQGRDRGGERVPVVELFGVRAGYPGADGPPFVLGPPPGPAFDLRVRAGELVAVCGPSGTGKSTLLRVALGLQRPDTGAVQLGGMDLTGIGRDAAAAIRARTCAVVGQQVALATTVDAIGQIDLARAARGLPADPDAVGLLERLGLGALTRRRTAELPGGERQRVALARALAQEPELLVLDEPTSQLDEASTELVAGVLAETARDGTAILVATHDPVLTRAADRLVRLGDR